ncbi:MAG: hypothetical protein RML40_10340 [Bacteroidota bacterium]|nr:hypothetical protein [Candidatus Kapabacteria bacterium]MDW8220911.1 hypothetical protein [Bacteroidota bacterium]
MARVIFTVSYEIPEQHRSEYLELVRHLKPLLNANGTTYTVCELENKRNHFQEIYTYPSKESYEASDDTENAQAEDIIEKIYSMAKDHKVSYTTAIEVL